MNKAQALQKFWSGFGIPAYDETTIPENPGAQYITYSVATASIENVVNLHAKIWDIGTNSWQFVEEKAEEIARTISEMNPPSIKLDNGRLYIAEGNPFGQRYQDDQSDTARCIYINIQAEYLAAY